MDILKENFECCDDNLYIAFDCSSEKLLSTITSCQIPRQGTVLEEVSVEFEVKHSYFNGLIRAVNMIQSEIISRILPSKKDFQLFSAISEQELERLFLLPQMLGMHLDRGQLSALKCILTSDPRSPPVLVTGSFGTGKTQLIAVASHCLVEQGRIRNQMVRVLVCAHHQATADNLVEKYFGPMLHRQPNYFELVRLISNYAYPPQRSSFLKYYKAVNLLNFDFRPPQHHLIIATTFGTSRSLRSKVGNKFFTHIVMDEGSQTREPESIAPLCLASPNTKLVIAGDSNQVSSILNCLVCIILKYNFEFQILINQSKDAVLSLACMSYLCR